MMGEMIFGGSFTQQEPIGEEAIEAAVRVMRSGWLHRYNVAGGEISEAAALEQDFATWQGARYCLVCAGRLCDARRAPRLGLEPGEPVLSNAFTLSPVPGAIRGVGGRPVLVESTAELTLDLDDFSAKIETSGARLLMISHMRGHLADMDALMALRDRKGVALIEGCAQTMGAHWSGRRSGSFGVAAGTQTYKHLNSARAVS